MCSEDITTCMYTTAPLISNFKELCNFRPHDVHVCARIYRTYSDNGFENSAALECCKMFLECTACMCTYMYMEHV